MRKVLLASAALVLLGAPVAMAAGTQGVIVSATVTETCSLTDPNDVSFGTDPLVGATDSSSFDLECNFAGVGGNPILLSVSFSSFNGGLKNVNDPTARGYEITYGTNAAFTAASAFAAPVPFADSVVAANTAESRGFDVELTEELPVAGGYTDTLTVAVVP